MTRHNDAMPEPSAVGWPPTLDERRDDVSVSRETDAAEAGLGWPG